MTYFTETNPLFLSQRPRLLRPLERENNPTEPEWAQQSFFIWQERVAQKKISILILCPISSRAWRGWFTVWKKMPPCTCDGREPLRIETWSCPTRVIEKALTRGPSAMCPQTDLRDGNIRPFRITKEKSIWIQVDFLCKENIDIEVWLTFSNHFRTALVTEIWQKMSILSTTTKGLIFRKEFQTWFHGVPSSECTSGPLPALSCNRSAVQTGREMKPEEPLHFVDWDYYTHNERHTLLTRMGAVIIIGFCRPIQFYTRRWWKQSSVAKFQLEHLWESAFNKKRSSL